jgi:hypothetical protein
MFGSIQPEKVSDAPERPLRAFAAGPNGFTLRGVGERQHANNSGGVRERVTIREAATLLGVHPNTVRNHVKAGVYQAEKVFTERGPTWMIDRDSLTTNALSSESQQLVGRVPQEALTILAREIVKEAGLARNPEQEAAEKRRQEFIEGVREYYKTQVDFFKHISTLSAATIVGFVAVAGAYLPRSELAERTLLGVRLYLFLLLSLAVLFAGLVAAALYLMRKSKRLARFSIRQFPAHDAHDEKRHADEEQWREEFRTSAAKSQGTVLAFYVTGVSIYVIVFVASNIIPL